VPLSLRRGVVTAVHERHEGLARVEVDGQACVAYPQLTGPVALGDEVVVNTQARDLGLGSGGFDVLYVNLTRGLGLPAEPGAHVMKLPYTPLQVAARHAEEESLDTSQLEGMPVVCCSVHSQVVPVFAALTGLRVAYVQLEGGALPLALSDAVRTLIASSASVGACFGGDVECVNVWSALAWAKNAEHATTTVTTARSVERRGSRAILTTTNSAMSASPAGIAAARQLDEISRVGVVTTASILTCSIAAGSSITMKASVIASVNGSAKVRSAAGRRLTTVFMRRFSLRLMASAAPSMPSHRKIVEASSSDQTIGRCTT